MKEIKAQTSNLIGVIKNSNECNQYQKLLNDIMQDSILYGKLNEFRKKSLALQLGNEADLFDGLTSLREEYAELLMDSRAEEFLFAEQQYCKMIRFVQTRILDATAINIDFLEG